MGDLPAPEGNTQLERLSAETRRATSDLIARLKEQPNREAVDRAQSRLVDVEQGIENVVNNLPDQARDRSQGLLQIGQDTRRIAGLLAGEFAITIRDGSREQIAGCFGQIIRPEEVASLASQSDVTSSYISTKSADSAVLAHLDSFGKFLNDWWLIAVMPAAELFSRATTGTTQISISVTVAPAVREAITESERLRQQRVTSDLEETLSSAKTATTTVGENELTRAFAEVKDEANCGVQLWTAGVFLFVLLGIAAPFLAINADIEALRQLTGLSGLLIKVSSSLPLFALAGYCGHIAAQHRETARHLTILIAQIKSARAYTNELPDATRSDLLAALGHRAFADPGFVSSDKGNVTLIPNGATDFVQQLRGLVLDARKLGN